MLNFFSAHRSRGAHSIEAAPSRREPANTVQGFHHAVRLADMDAVKRLLRNCPTLLNSPDAKGRTALHWAAMGSAAHPDFEAWCQCGDSRVADNEERQREDDYVMLTHWLLEQPNVDADARSIFGESPLHLAVTIARSIRLINTLLDGGASIHAVDANGDSALHLAVRGRWRELEITGLLVARGDAKLLALRNNAGATAKELADASLSSQREQVIELLSARPQWSDVLHRLVDGLAGTQAMSADMLWTRMALVLDDWQQILAYDRPGDAIVALDCLRTLCERTNDAGRLAGQADWIEALLNCSTPHIEPSDIIRLMVAISGVWRRHALRPDRDANEALRIADMKTALAYACHAHEGIAQRRKSAPPADPAAIAEAEHVRTACENAFIRWRLAAVARYVDRIGMVSLSAYWPRPSNSPAERVQALIDFLRRLMRSLECAAVASRTLQQYGLAPLARNWHESVHGAMLGNIDTLIRNGFQQARNILHSGTLLAELADIVIACSAALAAHGDPQRAARWCANIVAVRNGARLGSPAKLYPYGPAEALEAQMDRLAQTVPPERLPPLYTGGPTVHRRRWRRQLNDIRDWCAGALSRLGPACASDRAWYRPEPLPFETLQQNLTAAYGSLIHDLIATCEHLMLVDPPCGFAVLGLGSLSRAAATPFSDFEYAVLVDRDAFSADSALYDYFVDLTILFEFAVASLGETEVAPLARPRGLRIDTGAGVTVGQMHLINNPRGLAREVAISNNIAQASVDGDQGIAYSLLTPSVAFGDAALVEQYLDHLRGTRAPAPSGDRRTTLANITLPQVSALQQWRADHGPFLRGRLPEDTRDFAGVVDIKHAFVAPLSHTLTTLALAYGYTEREPRLVLLRLAADRRFVAPFVADWRWALAVTQAMRFRHQLRHGEQRDEVNWTDLTAAERADLIAVEWRVIRPLLCFQSTMLQRDPEAGPVAVLERLHAMVDFDPALSWASADSETTASAARTAVAPAMIRSVAATLAHRRETASVCLACYRRIMDASPPADYWKRWSIWTEEFERVPEAKPVLQALLHDPRPDGWRASREVEQHGFIAHLRTWCRADTVDTAATVRLSLVDESQPGAGVVQTLSLCDDIAQQLIDKGKPRAKSPARPGRQSVLPVDFLSGGMRRRYWVKLFPENPGIEMLIHGIDCRLNGGKGTPVSTLVRLTLSDGEEVAALVMEDLGEKSLDEALQRWSTEDAIDRASFTQALLRTLLVNPEDDKGNDYRLVPLGAGRWSIARLDNERAFFKVSSNGVLLGLGKALQVKSQLFCLDLMRQPLDPDVLQRFRQIDPLALLQAWFAEAQLLQERLRMLFPSVQTVRAHFERQMMSLLVVALPEGLARELLTRFDVMQRFIATAAADAPRTGMDLLRGVQPELWAYYEPAFVKIPGSTPADALARFAWRTAGAYKSGVDGALITKWGGNQAVTQSLALPRMVRWSDVQSVREERSLVLGDEVAFLDSAQADDASRVLKAVLEGDADGPARFARLAARQQMSLLDGVSAQLKREPDAYPVKTQTRLLSVLPGVPFTSLDLSGFDRSLTDDLLIPILHGANRHLCTVDLSRCSALTLRSMEALAELCPGLEMLTIRDLGTAAGNSPGLTELRRLPVPFSNPIEFPSLRELDLSDCRGLTRVQIKAPRLRRVVLAGLALLTEVGTGSTVLQEVDLRGCAALTEPALAAITDDWNTVQVLCIEGCPELRHPAFRQRFPWLADLRWNEWSTQTVRRLKGALSRHVGPAMASQRQRCRAGIAMWRNAVDQAHPVLVSRAAETLCPKGDKGSPGRTECDTELLEAFGGLLAFKAEQAIVEQLKALGGWSPVRPGVIALVLESIGRHEPEPFLTAFFRGSRTGKDGGRSGAALAELSEHDDAWGLAQALSLLDRGLPAHVTDWPSALQRLCTAKRSPASDALLAAYSSDSNRSRSMPLARVQAHILAWHANTLDDDWTKALLQDLGETLAGGAPHPSPIQPLAPRDARHWQAALADALLGTDRMRQAAALWYLEHISPLDPAPVAGALVHALESHDPYVRSQAARVLSRPEAATCEAVIAALQAVRVREANWHVMYARLSVLLHSDDPAHALPLLHFVHEGLERAPVSVQRAIVQVLKRFRLHERLYVPALYRRAVHAQTPDISAWGIEAMGQVCLPVVPPVRINLADLNASAGDGLHSAGREADIAAPCTVTDAERRAVFSLLENALHGADDHARAAAGILTKCDPSHLGAILTQRLSEAAMGTPTERLWALKALDSLVRFGNVRSRRIAIAARRLLKHESVEVREAALDLIGLLRASADASLFMAVRKRLDDDVASVRLRAMTVIGALGSGSADLAFGALQKPLKDKNVDVRTSAAIGLGHFGHADIGRVAPVLIESLLDRQASVRDAAIRSLHRILQPEAVIEALFPSPPSGYVDEPRPPRREVVAGPLAAAGLDGPATGANLAGGDRDTNSDTNSDTIRDANSVATGDRNADAGAPSRIPQLTHLPPFPRVSLFELSPHAEPDGHAGARPRLARYMWEL